MLTQTLLIIALIVLAYLLGSIPSAVWIGKTFYDTDVRDHGSKNAGATNTLRVLGKRAAIVVFLIDAAKGFLAVSLCRFSGLEFNSEPFINLEIALMGAAVVGHIFPIFASFKGGKGVATTSGAILALAPLPLTLSFIVFVVVFSIWKYVSLSSIVGGITFPLFVVLNPWIWNESLSPTLTTFSIVIAVAMVFMHRKNIKRLRSHTEPKTLIFTKKS